MYTNFKNLLDCGIYAKYNFLHLIYARKASQMWISTVRVFDWLYMHE